MRTESECNRYIILSSDEVVPILEKVCVFQTFSTNVVECVQC